jgi:hypothetical protein
LPPGTKPLQHGDTASKLNQFGKACDPDLLYSLSPQKTKQLASFQAGFRKKTQMIEKRKQTYDGREWAMYGYVMLQIFLAKNLTHRMSF